MKGIRFTLSVLIALSCLCAKAALRKDKRTQETIRLLTSLERGLFGEKDIATALKLEKRCKNDYERSWIIVVIAHYKRALERDPEGALSYLAPHALGENAGKAWAKRLKAENSRRKSKWVQEKNDAYRKKLDPPEEPTGLAIDFPPASQLKVEEETVHIALEVARCLMDLGKIRQALAVIDSQGKRFQNDGLVLSFECLGDLYVKMQMLGKAVGSYGNGLKVLKRLKPTEGFSSWQQIVRSRIERKLAETKKLLEIEKYGPGWVMYRNAEVKRRRDKLYLDAIWIYDQIMKQFPKSVFSEASKCYKSKCLLELATRKYPGKGEQKSLAVLEKELQKEKAFYSLAKRCRVPKASLEEIRATVDAIEKRFKAYKAIPYGKKALSQGKQIVRDAVKENMWGLYRGEMLVDIAEWAFSEDLDPELADKYYRQAWSWLEGVGEMDAAVAAFSLPAKASSIGQPTRAVVTKDKWGNVVRTTIGIGNVVNRNTAPWYNDELRSDTIKAIGFICFYRGERNKALKWYEQIHLYDGKSKLHSQLGQPDDYVRLSWGANHGFLYASPEELMGFGKRQKFAVLLADYYYCTERNTQSLKVVAKLQSGTLGRMAKKQLAYLSVLKGSVLYRMRKMKESFNEFETALVKAPSGMSRDRLLRMAYNTSIHGGKGAEARGIKYLEELALSRSKTDTAQYGKISYGLYLLRSGSIKEGKKVLTSFRDPGFLEMGQVYYNDFLERQKRDKNGEQ